MTLPDSSILTNIFVAGVSDPDYLLFEKKYITIRHMEDRLYSDEELNILPDIAVGHAHYREWASRKRSCRRLVRYLTAKEKPLRILEIGCGNGWLCHQLSRIPGARITGLDINFTELQQAARVFSDAPNIRFINGDMNSGRLPRLEADAIIFADSIQYFWSLRKMIQLCMLQLAPGGEIHILDSKFYKSEEVAEAEKKTLEYYTSMGFPEMADYYFHHTRKALQAFHPRVLFNSLSIGNRLLQHNDPYPWYCIKK
jgi:SAM-dependent methyltransferase